uniref:Uncharacterized protein n=1 Tax=viral metagenome TaxID=1070528 RepID=A0A6C0JUU2_9ZZZZ
MSTLLSDLESSPGPGKDGDLVDQIIKEMNGGSGGGPQGGANMFVTPQPPPSPAMMPSNPGMMPVQMSNTALSSHHMDNGPATAHMIGGAQPTAADFAAAMHGGSPLNNDPEPTPAYERPHTRPSKRSMLQRIGEEFKIPMLVALLVFVFSLPVVNFLFAHYLPYLVLPTGQLKVAGLVIKSLAAGVMFWVLQRIIVPLFSL